MTRRGLWVWRSASGNARLSPKRIQKREALLTGQWVSREFFKTAFGFLPKPDVLYFIPLGTARRVR